LSEGLAEFSALWYLQSERKHNDEYFKFLDQYKADIKTFRDDTGPIWIGYRTWTPKRPRAHDVTIYEKGAWVFHMLRILMLDLRTKSEDRFTAMMRDYYLSYRGKPATTEDFQRVVEQHVGMPMDWFFDQWIKGTGIPAYRVAWTNEPASGGKYTVRLRVAQQNVPPDFRMPVVVSVDLGEQRFAHFRVDVRGTQTEYTSPLLPAPAREVKFNELHGVLADVKMERW
jgi:aminopeptidase N